MGLLQVLRIVFLVILVLLQIVALCLAISALATPLWIDTAGDNRVEFERDGVIVRDLEHAGLWQLCFEPLFVNSTADENQRLGLDELRSAEDFGDSWQEAFGSIDDCTRDGIDDFYKAESVWGEDMWPRVVAVRAMAILFVITGFIKLFCSLIAKCSRGGISEKGGWTLFYIAIAMAVFELVWGVIGVALWSTVVVGAADEGKSTVRQETNQGRIYDDFRDYSGASYWLYMVATLLALIANIMICT